MAYQQQVNQVLSDLQSMEKSLSIDSSIQTITPQWQPLHIGDLVAKVPIIQGGMGVGVSLSSLASSVANEGGIGIIAANGIGLIEKDYYQDGQQANIRALRREIRQARQLSDGIIGVNIMVALSDVEVLLQVSIEERVDLICMGAGLPIKNLPIKEIREHNIKVVPIVSSARAIKMICSMWNKLYQDIPDAFVVEGPLAGGHLGFSEVQINDPSYTLEKLVVECRSMLDEIDPSIPLIAAGGVYSGKDIHRMLALGAQGVQMGTRFVATTECDADEAFKQAYVNCTKDEIGLINSPVGLLGRAIRNQFISDSEEGKRPSFNCAWKCLSSCKAQDAHYCISIALNNARRGYLKSGFVFCGTNAYRVKNIVSVSTLMKTLFNEYQSSVMFSLSRIVAKFKESQKHLKIVKSAYEEALLVVTQHTNRILDCKKQYIRALSTFEQRRISLIQLLYHSSLALV
ncbi:MAG: NAD(P)H-dependent flavin oxidoreductase [Sphaerochaetaceae bacterium]|jgi:nitronate monooxygenase